MLQKVDVMGICYIRLVMALDRRDLMFIHIQRRLLLDVHSTHMGIPEPLKVG